MKRFLLFLTAAALIASLGCDKAQSPTTPETFNLGKNEATLADTSAEATSLAAERQVLEKAKHAIKVPDDYPTIQAAVDAAVAGDMIRVGAAGSPYNEAVTVTTPGLSIRAEESVVVNGGFLVKANDVFIGGFNINVTSGVAGVAVVGASGVRVKHNTMSGNGIGIFLARSSSCMVTHNTVKQSSLFASTGLVMFKADSNVIRNNSFTANDFGITMQSCNNNDISGNTGSSNLRHGLTMSQACTGNRIKENVFNNNGMNGFYISGGTDNTFGPDNTANFNAQHGIMLFFDAGNNTVFRNNFHCNGSSDVRDDVGTNVFIENSTGPLPGGCQ